MTKKTVKIECPFCKRQFRFGKAANHRKNHHPELEIDEFIAAIKQAKKQGKLKFRSYDLQNKAVSPMRTATNALQESGKKSKGVRSVVSAGAFELGKKR